MNKRIFPIEPPHTSEGKAANPAAPSQEEKAARAVDNEEEPRLPRIWIPVVIGLGLLMASGYVGGRILASRPRHIARPAQIASPAAPQQVAHAPEQAAPASSADNPAAAPAQPEITPVAPAEDAHAQLTASNPEARPDQDHSEQVHSLSETAISGSENWGLITPQPGARYIQISALNTAAARRYVEQLRHGPLEPHLAPGPTPTILRVLLGPFHDTDLLLNTRADLKAAGIDCFIREY